MNIKKSKATRVKHRCKHCRRLASNWNRKRAYPFHEKGGLSAILQHLRQRSAVTILNQKFSYGDITAAIVQTVIAMIIAHVSRRNQLYKHVSIYKYTVANVKP